MKNKKLYLLLTALMFSSSIPCRAPKDGDRRPSLHTMVEGFVIMATLTNAIQAAVKVTTATNKILEYFLGLAITRNYIPDAADIEEALRRSPLPGYLKPALEEAVQQTLTNVLGKLRALGETPKEYRTTQHVIEAIVEKYAWSVFTFKQDPQLTDGQFRDFLSPLATDTAKDIVRARVLEILNKLNAVAVAIEVERQ